MGGSKSEAAHDYYQKEFKLFSHSLSGAKYASQGPTKLPKSATEPKNRLVICQDKGDLNVLSLNYFLATSKSCNSESVMFECVIKV